MPPTFTDDGLRAAQQIRAEQPAVGVLLLSQYVDVVYALGSSEDARRIGYLLKDRIVDLTRVDRRDAPRRGRRARRRAGARRGARRRPQARRPARRADRARARDPRPDGRGTTDRGIREALWLSQKTVESHVRSIFRKLDLPATPTTTAACTPS